MSVCLLYVCLSVCLYRMDDYVRLEHALTGSVLSAVSRGRDVLDEQTGLIVPETSLSQSQNLYLQPLSVITGASICPCPSRCARSNLSPQRQIHLCLSAIMFNSFSDAQRGGRRVPMMSQRSFVSVSRAGRQPQPQPAGPALLPLLCWCWCCCCWW